MLPVLNLTKLIPEQFERLSYKLSNYDKVTFKSLSQTMQEIDEEKTIHDAYLVKWTLFSQTNLVGIIRTGSVM